MVVPQLVDITRKKYTKGKFTVFKSAGQFSATVMLALSNGKKDFVAHLDNVHSSLLFQTLARSFLFVPFHGAHFCSLHI